MDNFAWARQLECPSTVLNNAVKKTLCKGVLEFLWEDISTSAFPVTEICKIKKNILLYKLRHDIKDFTIASVKDLSRLRSKSSVLKQRIAVLDQEYEEQDYVVREKMQRLKDIKNKCSLVSTRKDLLKLKHREISKEWKDYSNIRQVCSHLMPNTCKDMDQQKLRKNLDVTVGLRSTADKKQVWKRISSSLGDIDTYILWTHLYQALTQDLDILMKLDNASGNCNSSSVMGENIDIGIAKACGQYICMILKRASYNIKVNIHQQHLIKYIELIESVSNQDVSTWLVLMLEVTKLETEQACLQSEIQKLKNDIQDNSLLNCDIAQLTANIKTIDTQIDKYVKNIQQSIAVLNLATSLIAKVKEKLHHELQKIVALLAEPYDANCMNNALEIELDMFYNSLDLNALRKVMLRGDVKLYRHAICGVDGASVTTINPQFTRVKVHFPMIQMPVYCLIECFKNVIANSIYTKQCSAVTENAEYADKLVVFPREKCDYNSLELLSLSKVACDQARQEIERYNALLHAWTNQDVQEAMALDETTVDGVSFKDWLKRYHLLLRVLQSGK